jgi:hypothetical protein
VREEFVSSKKSEIATTAKQNKNKKSREEKSRAAKYRIAFLDNRLLAFVWQ